MDEPHKAIVVLNSAQSHLQTLEGRKCHLVSVAALCVWKNSQFNLRVDNTLLLVRITNILKVPDHFLDEFPAQQVNCWYWWRSRKISHISSQNWLYENLMVLLNRYVADIFKIKQLKTKISPYPEFVEQHNLALSCCSC